MKKIIPLFIALLAVMSACSINSPPNLNENFLYSCTVNFNDATYNADVDYHDRVLYFTPTSTNAAGMTISCDGSNVTYSYNNMINSTDMTKVSVSNPAVILYEVIGAFYQSDIDKEDDCYTVKGKISAGDFVLKLDSQYNIISLDISDIDFSATFSQKN